MVFARVGIDPEFPLMLVNLSFEYTQYMIQCKVIEPGVVKRLSHVFVL